MVTCHVPVGAGWSGAWPRLTGSDPTGFRAVGSAVVAAVRTDAGVGAEPKVTVPVWLEGGLTVPVGAASRSSGTSAFSVLRCG